MTDEPFIAHVAKLKDACKSYNDEQSEERTMAQEYYRGEMSDMKADEGRSSVVSQDVRAVIKKVMPSLTRTLLSNDKLVTYEPVGPEDEEGAEQATDYVNYVVVPECDAETAIFDAIHDACLVKTGILKWSAYKCRKAMVYDFSDQPDMAIIGLFDDPDNEIIDHEKTEETDPQVLALDPNARRHTFKLKRIETSTKIKLEAVPRERFLISPGADSIEDAEIVGEELAYRRTDLVAMGYDKAQVWRLSAYRQDDEADEIARRGQDWSEIETDTRKALDEVVVWEMYVKHDEDDDGIAELHRVVFGEGSVEDGGRANHVILGKEIVAEAPYADVVIERDAHQFEGHSIYEDEREVQRVKTALLRGSMDNIYAVNNPRPVVDLASVHDPESVSKTEHGYPILLKAGRVAREVLDWMVTPFVADKSFAVLEYWDNVSKERTGITDASAGLDASQVQNVNTGVAALLSEGGVAQADAIVRSVARGGLRKAFRGLLKLVIAHADQPKTVRIRGEWKQYDPRVWNTDMDCSVNTGLGGGTKERDLAVLQLILGIQKDMLLSMGLDVGTSFVKPNQLYNTAAKIVETAGFPNADPFFSEPQEGEIEQKMQAAASRPDPEIQKEQMKIEAQMRLEQAKQETNRHRETAQLEADLHVKQAEIQARAQDNAQQREMDRQKWLEELTLRREDAMMKERLELAKIEADLIKHREEQELQAKMNANRPVPDLIPGGVN